MSYTVSEPRIQDGFTWAEVHAGGEFVGRIVHVEPSDTWRPDQSLADAVGQHTWATCDDAKAYLEGL